VEAMQLFVELKWSKFVGECIAALGRDAGNEEVWRMHS